MVTQRQETILRLIVNDYITTAVPISSDGIARHRELGVSPATIRNDVADLEERDYLTRPHTSAGSVPLDKAYRFYVESILTLEEAHLPYEVQAAVRRELNRIEREIDEWANVAAAVLAKIVGNMAIATFPMAMQPRVKHVELVPRIRSWPCSSWCWNRPACGASSSACRSRRPRKSSKPRSTG